MIDYRKELEDFTYIVSHDLNAPLRHVREFGKLLIQKLGDKVTDQEREYFHYMERGIYKTETMLAGLLECSRLNTQTGPVEACDMGDIVREVVHDLQHSIDEAEAHIIVGNLPVLPVDKGQIKMLFFHLLDNTLKFRREGVPPEINISAEAKDGAWLFSIEDNGPGIPSEQTENAFIIFRRLHTDENIPGTGMGLALAKKIIERHGGEVSIESVSKEGTNILFSIPY